jgi:hypothetical protein
MFLAHPDAVARTQLATYRGLAGFLEKYPGTADRNIGSQRDPVTMPGLTVRPGQPAREPRELPGLGEAVTWQEPWHGIRDDAAREAIREAREAPLRFRCAICGMAVLSPVQHELVAHAISLDLVQDAQGTWGIQGKPAGPQSAEPWSDEIVFGPGPDKVILSDTRRDIPHDGGT